MADDTCDYAACDRPAARSDAGWEFCAQHYREHRADMYGEPWPPMQPVALRHLFAPPCGTSAAYRRHYRAGEQPCTSCVEAENRRRNPHNPNGLRGSWLRPVAS